MYPGPDPRALPRVPPAPVYTEAGWVGPPPQIQVQPQPVFVQMNAPRPFNHGPHVLADLMTCGLWIPAHLLLWVLHRG